LQPVNQPALYNACTQTSSTSKALTSSLEANTVQLEAQNNITLTGAKITANTASLTAIDGQVSLVAAQTTQTTQSAYSSQGSSIGVGIQQGKGVQLTLSANQSEGTQNSQSTQHKETVIKAQNLTLNSGTDTVLTGAVLQADRITGTIGGDLIIRFQQDTNTYTSESESAGFSVGIPLLPGAGGGTASLSINASQAKDDANFQALQNNLSEEQVQIAQESVQASQILGNVAPKLVESFSQGKLDDANDLEEQAARLEEINPEEAQQLLNKANEIRNDWGEDGEARKIVGAVANGLIIGNVSEALQSTAVSMLGQDVAEAIGNAAENNALFLIPIAVALINAIDVGLTAKDAYDLAEAIDAGDEEEANRLATEFAINAVLSVTCEDK
jgi:hypothetical protein